MPVLLPPCRDLSANEQPQQQQEQQQQQQQIAGGCYADVEQLQSHWQDLDAARKVMYAQMAVLTRCGKHLHPLQWLALR